jgi:hypothetical protein
VLYGKAAYLAAHQHRFSFPTVGFFDGRIHVASAAHPAGEMRSLLFHEFTHAVFAERSGGDRPFWLNEGLAELAERASRGERGISRSERALLRQRIDAGEWIALERLAPGFGGLDEASARIAYLESTAAAAWVESHAGAAGMGALLDAIAAGHDFDAALRRAIDADTAQLGATLRRQIQSEFAPWAKGGASSPFVDGEVGETFGGSSWDSTRSTRAWAGSWRTRPPPRPRGPSRRAPSARLRTHPETPRARAWRCVALRNHTPCTRP